ncbi:exo-alpha-sialidase [uncultured Draconibacterium sp.]|uniref:exo-alpha-sialidase n=1 Tax=uncultured Draconibacterium sp. TaxID=1573823 RepID=UPI00326057F1
MIIKLSVTLFALVIVVFAMGQEIDLKEPVKYVGTDHTSNSDYINGYHDGQMRPAVGVQNYQIFRANRSYPEKSDGLGWTYNHAPNLAYWNNRFYCHYLANPTGEHIAPGATLITSSADGKNWDKPQLIFPIYYTTDSNANINFMYMHQRMGFYVAPNGRLLTMGFYGAHYGVGAGRVVREIYENGEFGPIYFIRINDNWEKELRYPFFTESADSGFVAACNAFLNDKVKRMQWWEEHRLAEDRKDFFRVPPIDGKERPGQAFCFYTLPDSTIVGFFKSRWVTTSNDNGNTWTAPVQCNTLTYGGAKIWGQRLDNGQYALVYNPTNSMARHPLSIATSNDGLHFNNLLNVHTEVPVKRFWGMEKRPGPQYMRGIVEGNGNPPGDDMWVVYSVSKEDMWIARIPVPVQGEVTQPVNDNFNEMIPGGVVANWNIYSPRWCPVEVSKSPSHPENVLCLKDADPYDYAKAVRVFARKAENTIHFQLFTESNPELLAIELLAANGARCIQLQLDSNGQLLAKNGENRLTELYEFKAGQWVSIDVWFNAENEKYQVSINGKTLAKDFQFAAEGSPERIEFRTGEYRLTDDVQKFKSGDKYKPGWDEPGADERVPEAVFYLKEFYTER